MMRCARSGSSQHRKRARSGGSTDQYRFLKVSNEADRSNVRVNSHLWEVKQHCVVVADLVATRGARRGAQRSDRGHHAVTAPRERVAALFLLVKLGFRALHFLSRCCIFLRGLLYAAVNTCASYRGLGLHTGHLAVFEIPFDFTNVLAHFHNLHLQLLNGVEQCLAKGTTDERTASPQP